MKEAEGAATEGGGGRRRKTFFFLSFFFPLVNQPRLPYTAGLAWVE